jgi:hypothetical protein
MGTGGAPAKSSEARAVANQPDHYQHVMSIIRDNITRPDE